MSVKGMVVVMTFSTMVWKSLELKWTTEALYTKCCEGQDKILRWNYSLEKNETVQSIQWIFNKSTQIAYESESGIFHVPPLHKGRVEWNGKMGILLKNVSSVDTGEYTLQLNLATEQTESMETIFLTVYESPTYQCKPSITNHSENLIFCSTNSCGGIQVSTEWRISGKSDPVSNESYLKINSSWNAELVSCCLRRPDMQCQNGDFEFCASTTIFFAKDKHAPDCNYTENSVNLIPVVVVLAMTNAVFIAVFCFCYRRMICNLCEHQNATPEEQDIELKSNPNLLSGEQQNADPREQDNETTPFLISGEQQNANPREQDNETTPFLISGEQQNANPREQDNKYERSQIRPPYKYTIEQNRISCVPCVDDSYIKGEQQTANPREQDNENERTQIRPPYKYTIKQNKISCVPCVDDNYIKGEQQTANPREQDNENERTQIMPPYKYTIEQNKISCVPCVDDNYIKGEQENANPREQDNEDERPQIMPPYKCIIEQTKLSCVPCVDDNYIKGDSSGKSSVRSRSPIFDAHSGIDSSGR